MTTSAKTPPTFSSEELTQLLSLIKDSDSVELKLTVPESDQRSTVVALGMDPLEAQIRQVFFFETPDLKLDKAGVVVRARRIQGKGNDSVVKLRPVEPADMPAKLRKSAGLPRRGRRAARRVRLLGNDERHAASDGRANEPSQATSRCGSSSQRSNGRSTRRTRPRAWHWMT